MNLVSAAILLLLATLGVVVRKTYYYLPAHELKRRAESGDRQAAGLYRAVAYGGSLRTLLWLYIGLTTAASLVILARILPIWVSLLVVGPILWAAFSWLPSSRTTKLGLMLTRFVTPVVAWILNYTDPPLSRGAEAVDKRTSTRNHTGIFEREDLIKLIDRQQKQPDNRISDEELEIAKRALGFDDRKVRDVLIPRKEVKTVLANDTIGPVLIDEIHKSGQDSVLVRESQDGPVIGSLAFSKLSINSHGQIRDVMDTKVYYLHEEDSLAEALHAFFVTGYAVFVVVNNFEEFVGIITIEKILHELVGHTASNGFDDYTNLKAVATRHDQSPETQGEPAEEEPAEKPETEAPEAEIEPEADEPEQESETEPQVLPPGDGGTKGVQKGDNVPPPPVTKVSASPKPNKTVKQDDNTIDDEFESVEEIDGDETPVKTDDKMVE